MFRLIAVLLSACSLVACSSQSPVAPGAIAASESSLGAKPSSGVPGVYDLTFFAPYPNFFGAQQEVSSLPVLTAELTLRALVTDTLGNRATLGTVTFEYCSYGGRTNDINNADEAPKEACEQGLAKWARLHSRSVADGANCPLLTSGAGSACYNFGIVRIPRTVGFRFRYAQGKDSIASGMSEAQNFTWVPAP